MIDDIRKLIDTYLVWIKDKTTFREVNDWVEITTPYLDRHNDYLQIYVRKENNGNYIITDDGFIIENLEHSGCKLDSPKRQELLSLTLNGYGIQLQDFSLVTTASEANFALKKHNLIQSMLAVNDLFFLSAPMIISLFLEDVTKWLDLNEIRYTPKIKFTGKSGFDHLFDFVIPKSRIKPERILRTINRPSRDTVEALAFAWIDTKEIRPRDSVAYAFLNDFEQKPSVAVLDALQNYDVRPILWSDREQVKDELIA